MRQSLVWIQGIFFQESFAKSLLPDAARYDLPHVSHTAAHPTYQPPVHLTLVSGQSHAKEAGSLSTVTDENLAHQAIRRSKQCFRGSSPTCTGPSEDLFVFGQLCVSWMRPCNLTDTCCSLPAAHVKRATRTWEDHVLLTLTDSFLRFQLLGQAVTVIPST